MKLCLFTEVQCPPGTSPERRLDELLEQAALADALGYHALWISEIHFQPAFSLLAAPYVVLGAIAARTRRLRLGVAVNILPVHHPVQLAEQAATLDVLSHGRVDFVVGRGHLHSRVYEGFGAEGRRSQAIMEESLAVIRAAWTRDVLEFHGAYYDVPEVVVTPKPVQQPHPPVYVAATSPESIAAAARQGLDICQAAHLVSRAQLLHDLAAYREGLRRHGHDPAQHEVTLSIPVHVAETTARAQAQARDGFMDYFRVIGDVRADYIAWLARQGKASPLGPRDPITFEHLCAEGAIVSDPPTAIANLRRLIAETGVARILCWMNMGSIPHARVLESMALFAREVAPHLQAPAPQPDPA
ncbi:MAG TPA: LLM class flavin-dependent oxidoreductase [Chloroflexota bacterium]|nr:LLM class flavin-dependent oxidoreductase [Chloroflexota bacterium]